MSPDPDAKDTEVYRGGRLHVRDAACDRCLFGTDRLVDGARARELIAAARSREGGSFICHRNQVTDEPAAICAVYFERFAREDWVLRLAVAMEIIEWVSMGEGASNANGNAIRAKHVDAGEDRGETIAGNADAEGGESESLCTRDDPADRTGRGCLGG